MQQVDAATLLLQNYNGRLDAELEDRKRVALMLHDYMNALRGERAMAAQSKLDEYRSTLERVESARNELVAHLQKLPDMSRLFEQFSGSPPPGVPPVVPLGVSSVPSASARSASTASNSHSHSHSHSKSNSFLSAKGSLAAAAGAPSRATTTSSLSATVRATSHGSVRRAFSSQISAPVTLVPVHPSRPSAVTAPSAYEQIEPAVTPTTADSPLSIPSDL